MLAVDGSAYSRASRRATMENAEQFQADVTVIHVGSDLVG
jgi:hypothetical protein